MPANEEGEARLIGLALDEEAITACPDFEGYHHDADNAGADALVAERWSRESEVSLDQAQREYDTAKLNNSVFSPSDCPGCLSRRQD